MTNVVLWVFSDGRKGHEKQSLGLVQAIERLVKNRVEVCRIAVGSSFKTLTAMPKPNLILGAGNATHLPMLLSKLRFHAPCVVLMKPSLPTILFDLVLVPHHDFCSNFGNVHTTRGVLCPIPNARPDATRGVILLGGDSRHYHWNTESVVEAVFGICGANPEKQWTICDSPRSPSDLLGSLSPLPNGTTRQWRTTSETFITELLNASSETWVTSDSVTMLYEALNTGVPVGVIKLQTKRKTNKLDRGIQDLAKHKQVHLTSAGYSIDPDLSMMPPGQELRRCAKLCLPLLKNGVVL